MEFSIPFNPSTFRTCYPDVTQTSSDHSQITPSPPQIPQGAQGELDD
jgi:hypothetical protein